MLAQSMAIFVTLTSIRLSIGQLTRQLYFESSSDRQTRLTGKPWHFIPRH